MQAFWFVLSVVGLGMAAGAMLASLPRRRRYRSSARWVVNGETGLREYILTPWMRGARR